ncbi:MAG: SCO family protein [Verrucomicrobia bacterium]|nr:SCO family protein [Verrucomicrobiota bacterium]
MTRGLLLAVCLAVVAAGCRTRNTGPSQAADAVRVFEVKGVVRELPGGDTVRIRHEEIPGYMAAMTMPFTVKDPAELAGIQVGDTVTFRMTVTPDDGWIDQIRVLERARPEDVRPQIEGVRITRLVEELKVGDPLPNYQFTNELRQPVNLADFRGQALGLTFIYTRCPYPTFCPRQSQQFAEACARLKAMPDAPENWHLLSLSFDPAYDTPSVLRAYGQRHNYDPRRWNFLTGAMIDIDAITEQFGTIFARDGEGWSHNVRTVVIDAAGRVQRIFVGVEWTTDEFVAEMIKAARVQP